MTLNPPIVCIADDVEDDEEEGEVEGKVGMC